LPSEDRAIAHVLFDLDGTLIDSRADIVAAVSAMRARFALPALDSEVVHRYVGNGAPALVARALGEERRALWDVGLQEFLDYYGAHALDRTRLYPGIASVLAALRGADVSMSVVTNKPEGLSRRILAGLAALDVFIEVIGGDTLPAKKPDASGVWQALGRAGVSARRALVVGDSAVDRDTAAAAGVSFCGVTWGFAAADIVGGGAPYVSSAAALREVILSAW
jgi:phosphoglycolate phosphatase